MTNWSEFDEHSLLWGPYYMKEVDIKIHLRQIAFLQVNATVCLSWTRWSLLSLMLIQSDSTGKLGFHEFKHLWNNIKKWQASTESLFHLCNTAFSSYIKSLTHSFCLGSVQILWHRWLRSHRCTGVAQRFQSCWWGVIIILFFTFLLCRKNNSRKVLTLDYDRCLMTNKPTCNY